MLAIFIDFFTGEEGEGHLSAEGQMRLQTMDNMLQVGEGDGSEPHTNGSPTSNVKSTKYNGSPASTVKSIKYTGSPTLNFNIMYYLFVVLQWRPCLYR